MTYAVVLSGVPHELFPGEPFVDQSGIQHPQGVPSAWTNPQLATIGVYPIDESATVPPGERLVGTSLTLVGGVPTRVLTTEPIPLAEIKAARMQQLQNKYDSHRFEGFTWNFVAISMLDPNGISLGGAGFQTIPTPDLSSITLLEVMAVRAKTYLLESNPTAAMPIVTDDGNIIQTQALHIFQMLDAGNGDNGTPFFPFRAFYDDVYLRRRREITLATTYAEVQAVDINAEWS